MKKIQISTTFHLHSNWLKTSKNVWLTVPFYRLPYAAKVVSPTKFCCCPFSLHAALNLICCLLLPSPGDFNGGPQKAQQLTGTSDVAVLNLLTCPERRPPPPPSRKQVLWFEVASREHPKSRRRTVLFEKRKDLGQFFWGGVV